MRVTRSFFLEGFFRSFGLCIFPGKSPFALSEAYRDRKANYRSLKENCRHRKETCRALKENSRPKRRTSTWCLHESISFTRHDATQLQLILTPSS